MNEWRERGWGGTGAPHHDQSRPRVGARLAWVWPPQVAPQCFIGSSRPQIFQKNNIKLLGFFEKHYFRGNSRNLQFLKSRKMKSCKGGNLNQIITTKVLKYFNRQ